MHVRLEITSEIMMIDIELVFESLHGEERSNRCSPVDDMVSDRDAANDSRHVASTRQTTYFQFGANLLSGTTRKQARRANPK